MGANMGEKGDMMKPKLTTREILRDLWEEKKLTCGSLPSIRLCVVLIELSKFYTVSTEPADGNNPP